MDVVKDVEHSSRTQYINAVKSVLVVSVKSALVVGYIYDFSHFSFIIFTNVYGPAFSHSSDTFEFKESWLIFLQLN